MIKKSYPIMLLLTLIALCISSVRLTGPPKALAIDAPKHEFSATRALLHLKQITKEPHPSATPALTSVRNYLIAELDRLGIPVQVQNTTVTGQKRFGSVKAQVYNIIGIIKGKSRGKAVLIMAHYDSRRGSPGAGDDGAGIAAILETARAIKVVKPLDNDVILLMTDGEEMGLLGAIAFMKHPLAQEVGLVMNMEGRGTSGPSLTFEMSPENGWLVEEFAKAAPFPIASSLFHEVYKLLPNDTDFTIFKSAGYTGLNSAFIDGFVNYHTPNDSYDNFNPNSLQHHGSNLLALTKHFASISLLDTKSADKTFFNPAGTWLVHYHTNWNFLLIMIAIFFLAAIVRYEIINKILNLKQLIVSAFLYLFIFIISGGIFLIFNKYVLGFMKYQNGHGIVSEPQIFFLGYLSLAIAIFVLLSRQALRWVNVFSMSSAVYFIILMLVITMQITKPGTAYFLIFPLIFCLGSVLLILYMGLHLKNKSNYPLLLLTGLLPSIFMLIPIVSFLFILFDLHLPMISMLLFILFMGLGFPLIYYIDHAVSWKNISLLSLVFLLIAGILVSVAINRNNLDLAFDSQATYNYALKRSR